MDEQTKKKKEIRPPRKISKSYLQNAGLYYLERYPASVAHFKMVMQRKIDRSIRHHGTPSREECAEWLDDIADKYVEYGYLNDLRYAEGLIHSLQQKGRAEMKIRARLKQAGIDEHVIVSLMARKKEEEAERLNDLPIPSNWPQQSSHISEYLAALKYAKKRRVGPYAGLARTPKEPEKALAMLARNGFSYDIAQVILQTDADEAEVFLLHSR